MCVHHKCGGWPASSQHGGPPRMFSYVSSWPANDISGKSSAVADERTATETSAPGSPYHRRIVSAMWAGIVPWVMSAWISPDAHSSVARSSAYQNRHLYH
jgi:hypothetical protein